MSPPRTPDAELMVLLNDPQASLEGRNMAGLDLSGLQLGQRRLAGASLRGASLRGADLAGADLTSCDLRSADLRGGSLDGADLMGADLRGADLTEVSCQGASFMRADLRKARLHEEGLIGADLQGARGIRNQGGRKLDGQEEEDPLGFKIGWYSIFIVPPLLLVTLWVGSYLIWGADGCFATTFGLVALIMTLGWMDQFSSSRIVIHSCSGCGHVLQERETMLPRCPNCGARFRKSRADKFLGSFFDRD